MCYRFKRRLRLIRRGFISICKKCISYEWVLYCSETYYAVVSSWYTSWNHHHYYYIIISISYRSDAGTTFHTIVYSSVRFQLGLIMISVVVAAVIRECFFFFRSLIVCLSFVSCHNQYTQKLDVSYTCEVPRCVVSVFLHCVCVRGAPCAVCCVHRLALCSLLLNLNSQTDAQR